MPLIAPPPAAASAPAAPTPAEAARIEAAYAPPRWGTSVAGPLTGYRRSYWRDPTDADLIVGQYVANRSAGVRLFASAAQAGYVFDGGCGVVNVRYRLSTHELAARCGGR